MSIEFANEGPSARDGAWTVVALPDRVVLPASCACCGGAAQRQLRVQRGARTLLVGYCMPCAAHVARFTTRRLSLALAASLFGFAVATATPILLPWVPLWACVSFAAAAVLLPLGIAARLRRPAVGHVAEGPAAFFSARSELVCLRAAWAEELLRTNPGALRAPASASHPGRLQVGASAAAAALIALLAHFHQHPLLRVLNLDDVSALVLVDGRPMGRVEPSSAESPQAGLEFRLPAGRRRLVTLAPDGRLLASADVAVIPGRHHLYAPARPDICFWLEENHYGRGKGELRRVALAGDTRFWALSADVQGWFIPGPPAADEPRATGGMSTVLRQGPCEDAPSE
jgi:hypothetical protein